MKKNYLLGLVLVVSLLFATTAKADFISGPINFTTNQEGYLGGIHGIDWDFAGTARDYNKNGSNQWVFTIETASGDTTSGTLLSNNYNGNDSNSFSVNNGIASGNSNSANTFTMSFIDPLVDTFYITLQPHSSFSAASAFNMTVNYWDAFGDLQTTGVIKSAFTSSNMFLGFNLDEGAFIQSVTFASIASPNNGFNIAGMGFGDHGLVDNPTYRPDPDAGGAGLGGDGGPAGTPEPATLLILGLGVVGAGFAARRRMTK